MTRMAYRSSGDQPPKSRIAPGPAEQHLVRDPDHPALEDVAAPFGVAVPEERRHPLVGSQAQHLHARGELLGARLSTGPPTVPVDDLSWFDDPVDDTAG
jgi:hypothetical protein